MININKKVMFLVVLIVVSLFSFSINVNALTSGWSYPKCLTGNYTLNGASKKAEYVGIYLMDGKHVYCIEPGTVLTSTNGYDAKAFIKDYNYNFITTNPKKILISQILTYAENLGTSVVTQAPDKSLKACSNKDQTLKVYAAQVLIWEVATGERTSFNHYAPDNNHSNSFYNNYIAGKSDALSIEYRRIIDAIYYAFNELPSNFSLESSAKTLPLSWDASKNKYTLTINDSTHIRYWTTSTNDGLDVSITNDSITISSSTPIEQSNPKKVTIRVYNKNGGDLKAYYHKNSQDLIGIVGTSRSAYLKVYTPKYQLKIIKKASLDGKLLSGAKFNICSNNSCTNILGTIITNKNGVATFTDIPAPGTYYVKETSSPEGYHLNTTPKAVVVSASNISGTSSYGTISISNTNKVFNLTKKTIDDNGNIIDLDDGCGTDTYTGPEFEIKENGNSLYFKELKPGEYDITSKDIEGATTKLRTCNGKFKVYTLPKCQYTISETKAPEGLTLPSEPTRSINVCGADKNVSFTNGFAGLEFQKKDEDGKFVEGGKFSLQKKVNNVYRDILLKQNNVGNYIYDSNLTEEDENATYMILTNEGIARITKLPPGEYRIVEKEAPEGYELIEDKDSKALVTIKDSDKDGYYLVEMIDQKVNKNGSKSSAELVVTITTGRKVLNYVLIISALSILLIIAIILRKKVKK